MSKSPLAMHLNDRKIDLTLRLYVDPADEDYVQARSAYRLGLFHAFYWSAGQACEKYLKGLLLLQDRSAQNYGHDLVSLFRDVCQKDPDNIIPNTLNLPETTARGRERWHGETAALFIEYLAKYGSPDNRYAFEGTFVNGPVLHALDILCCAFRRLMRAVNLTGGDLFGHQSTELMFHERIDADQNWMIDPTRLLERLYVKRYSVGQSRALRDTFSNMNFAFFETRSEGESSFGGEHYHGSPLHNHLVRLARIDASPSNVAAIEQLRAWAAVNIYMSAEVRGQLDLPKAVRRPR
ncbi:MAG: HEPN domain-containing protein [Janthinobacterium lividum]